MSVFLAKLGRFLASAVGVCVIAIFAVLFVLPPYLYYRFRGYPISISEDEVYECLSLTEWKSGLELHDELRERRRCAQQHDPLFDSPYAALTALEEADLAERRERALTPEQLASRGGRPAREYRRKPGGRRAKNEDRSWFSLPIPVPSWASA